MAMNIPAPVQILGGTKAEIAERIGSDRELNWAEDTHELYVHDGVTKGGHLVGGGGGTEVTAGPGIKVKSGEVSVDAVSSFAMATSVVSSGKLCGSCAKVTDVDTAASNADNLRGNYYSFGASTAGSLPFGNNLTQYISLGKIQIATDGERIAVRKHTSAAPPFEWTPWNYFSGTLDSQ